MTSAPSPAPPVALPRARARGEAARTSPDGPAPLVEPGAALDAPTQPVTSAGPCVTSGALPPLAVAAPVAAALFGLSARAWRRLDSAGLCPAPLRLGGAVRWDLVELTRWRDAGCPARPRWRDLEALRRRRP
jgi:hypothetical protein